LILRVITYLLYFLIAGAGVVLFLDKVEQPAAEQEYVNPCGEPITYHIESIDSRFDITSAQLRRLIGGVINLWSDAAGQKLIEYDRNGDVGIYLIFDDRQQLVEEEREFNSRIQMERLTFDRLHREYTRYSDQYDEALENYNALLRDYEAKVRVHNEEVTKWNEQGGAPEEEKSRVMARDEELNRMRRELTSLQNRVNRVGLQLEEVTDRLNAISSRKDELIGEYNERFSGEYRFNQGEYMHKVGERRINIYHYKSLNHLRLVLAHEFGHALGLGHVDSPGAVMYPVVESHGAAVVELSEQDIEAIQVRCNR
jgi:hypothetical protein